MNRASGILLPISSLPSPYGIGTFSKEAYEFADKLVEAGQSYWQILPLGPTGYGDSPYQPFSTFAGNPYLIDLETLIEEGLLTKEECEEADLTGHPNYIEYGKLYENRFPLLRKAYERSNIAKDEKFQAFVKENEWWVKDYALFMAVKKCFNGAAWSEWAQDIRMRWGYSLDYYYSTYSEEIEFYEFLQYKFFEQWTKLKTYVNSIGIKLIGDLPIYVAYDSADAWAHPQLFQFDDENYPVRVAGVPPDAFSETGQLWGNPLYNWDYHRQTGYDWWVRRMRHAKKLYDVVRIDHFRGFDSYYAIPAEDDNAKNGVWKKGPGMALFNALEEKLGKLPIIAEDLGFLTPSVINKADAMRMKTLTGMKVIQFAFDPREDSDYLPHSYPTNCVVYTGTHDNDTVLGWIKTAPKEAVKFAKEYCSLTKEEGYNWGMMRMAWASVADMAIVPMQDIIGLGSEARINIPSTLGDNWKWRATEDQINPKLAKRVRKYVQMTGRLNVAPKEETTEITSKKTAN